MRRAAVLSAMTLLAACSSSGSSNTGPTPSPAASPQSGPLAGSYGILFKPGNLLVVRPNGTVAATVDLAPPSTHYCSQQRDVVVAPPPVSASDDAVYFRDGDTKIRVVVPPDGATDVTTVPGGANVISFFSVSPDDQKIAVLVEDVSSGTAISLHLYVEDLRGGGHHAEIYNNLVPKDARGTTLWPMGWHQGRLVLAVWPACAFEPIPSPNSWHVMDASTGNQLASIGDASCIPSAWPSPAGVACFDSSPPGHVRVYDWTGKLGATLQTDTVATEMSLSGGHLAVGNGGQGNPSPSTTMFGIEGSGVVTTPGHIACLWIDESNLLAPDAVIAYPSGTATVLAQTGQCAGRFPGGL